MDPKPLDTEQQQKLIADADSLVRHLRASCYKHSARAEDVIEQLSNAIISAPSITLGQTLVRDLFFQRARLYDTMMKSSHAISGYQNALTLQATLLPDKFTHPFGIQAMKAHKISEEDQKIMNQASWDQQHFCEERIAMLYMGQGKLVESRDMYREFHTRFDHKINRIRELCLSALCDPSEPTQSLMDSVTELRSGWQFGETECLAAQLFIVSIRLIQDNKDTESRDIDDTFEVADIVTKLSGVEDPFAKFALACHDYSEGNINGFVARLADLHWNTLEIFHPVWALHFVVTALQLHNIGDPMLHAGIKRLIGMDEPDSHGVFELSKSEFLVADEAELCSGLGEVFDHSQVLAAFGMYEHALYDLNKLWIFMRMMGVENNFVYSGIYESVTQSRTGILSKGRKFSKYMSCFDLFHHINSSSHSELNGEKQTLLKDTLENVGVCSSLYLEDAEEHEDFETMSDDVHYYGLNEMEGLLQKKSISQKDILIAKDMIDRSVEHDNGPLESDVEDNAHLESNICSALHLMTAMSTADLNASESGDLEVDRLERDISSSFSNVFELKDLDNDEVKHNKSAHEKQDEAIAVMNPNEVQKDMLMLVDEELRHNKWRSLSDTVEFVKNTSPNQVYAAWFQLLLFSVPKAFFNVFYITYTLLQFEDRGFVFDTPLFIIYWIEMILVWCLAAKMLYKLMHVVQIGIKFKKDGLFNPKGATLELEALRQLKSMGSFSLLQANVCVAATQNFFDYLRTELILIPRFRRQKEHTQNTINLICTIVLLIFGIVLTYSVLLAKMSVLDFLLLNHDEGFGGFSAKEAIMMLGFANHLFSMVDVEKEYLHGMFRYVYAGAHATIGEVELNMIRTHTDFVSTCYRKFHGISGIVYFPHTWTALLHPPERAGGAHAWNRTSKKIHRKSYMDYWFELIWFLPFRISGLSAAHCTRSAICMAPAAASVSKTRAPVDEYLQKNASKSVPDIAAHMHHIKAGSGAPGSVIKWFIISLFFINSMYSSLSTDTSYFDSGVVLAAVNALRPLLKLFLLFNICVCGISLVYLPMAPRQWNTAFMVLARMIWFAIMASPMYFVFYPMVMGIGFTFSTGKEILPKGPIYVVGLITAITLQLAIIVLIGPTLISSYLASMPDLVLDRNTTLVDIVLSTLLPFVAFFVEAVNINMIRVQDVTAPMGMMFTENSSINITELMSVISYDAHRKVVAQMQLSLVHKVDALLFIGYLNAVQFQLLTVSEETSGSRIRAKQMMRILSLKKAFRLNKYVNTLTAYVSSLPWSVKDEDVTQHGRAFHFASLYIGTFAVAWYNYVSKSSDLSEDEKHDLWDVMMQLFSHDVTEQYMHKYVNQIKMASFHVNEKPCLEMSDLLQMRSRVVHTSDTTHQVMGLMEKSVLHDGLSGRSQEATKSALEVGSFLKEMGQLNDCLDVYSMVEQLVLLSDNYDPSNYSAELVLALDGQIDVLHILGRIDDCIETQNRLIRVLEEVHWKHVMVVTGTHKDIWKQITHGMRDRSAEIASDEESRKHLAHLLKMYANRRHIVHIPYVIVISGIIWGIIELGFYLYDLQQKGA